MSNARKPANVRAAEATDTMTTEIEFRGQTFTVTRDFNDMTVDFMESVEEGKTVGIVRGALGASQWRTVKGMNLKMSDLGELADKIAVGMGFANTGESAASSD